MRRRTVLQSLIGVLGLAPVARVELRLPAQQAAFGDPEIATLIAIAEVALPSALGRDGRRQAVDRFVRWLRNYREGADRGHSYGSSTLAQPAGPSPALRYPAQFAALDTAARGHGAASFVALDADKRRAVIESVLNQPTRVTTLPPRPTGANLVADFMGYYFNSGDGYDLAYNAAIGRDQCRSLDNSDQSPAPLPARTGGTSSPPDPPYALTRGAPEAPLRSRGRSLRSRN